MTEPIVPPGCISLDGALTVRTADTIRTTLLDALNGATGIAIDCSGATDADLSFVQLLIAARTSANRSGKTVCLTARPEGPLLASLTRAGFRAVTEIAAGGAEAFWFDGAW